MEDRSHLLVYQRFFAVVVSVIPGLNLVLGISGLLLFLFADVIEMEWGWGIGVTAIFMMVMFLGWIFAGIGIQKWAEQKPLGMLAGICAPFMLVDAVLMIWLFVETVIFASSPGGEHEAARVVLEALTSLA